jgi:hypothetical protein
VTRCQWCVTTVFWCIINNYYNIIVTTATVNIIYIHYTLYIIIYILIDLVPYRRATTTRRGRCTQTRADHRLCVSVIGYHSIYFHFYFFTFTNVLSTRPRHRHCILVRSQNTICDLNRPLHRSLPYYFYAFPIAFGRLPTRKRRTPGSFYFHARPSVPPLRGDLLDVKRFSTFFDVFIIVFRLIRRLFHRRPPTFLPFIVFTCSAVQSLTILFSITFNRIVT